MGSHLKQKPRAHTNTGNLSNGLRQHNGTSGENYLATLLGMDLVDNGTRRPDLQSIPNTGGIDIHLEVKSTGDHAKVDVDVDQLIHIARGFGYYEDLIGHKPPVAHHVQSLDSSLFKDSLLLENTQSEFLLFDHRTSPVFYSTLCRQTTVPKDDISKPYATMNLAFGDTYIYPFEVAFGIFLSEWARKRAIGRGISRIHVRSALNELNDYVHMASESNMSAHELRKAIPYRNGWQNISTHILRAIATGSRTPLARAKQQQRTYTVLEQQFPLLAGLQAYVAPGSNNTKHTFLFYESQRSAVHQVVSQIQANMDLISELDLERKSCMRRVTQLPHLQFSLDELPHFLKKTGLSYEQFRNKHELRKIIQFNKTPVSSYAVGCAPQESAPYLGISLEEMAHFERAIKWGQYKESVSFSMGNSIQRDLFD